MCAILNSSYNFQRQSPLAFVLLSYHGIFILRALIGPSIDQFGRLWIFCQTTLSAHALDLSSMVFLGQFVSEYMTIPLAACASFCCPMFDGQRTSIGTIVICICRSPPCLTIRPNKKLKGRRPSIFWESKKLQNLSEYFYAVNHVNVYFVV